MKKRKISVFISALLFLFTVLVPSAEEAQRQQRLVDTADLLTEQEEADLLKKLDEISERQNCDVAVVTVDSLEGKTSQEYADDYYDYNGYGMGSDYDGILLLISMEERDWAISTSGYGITAFTDAGLSYLSEKILPQLGEGKYNGAFTKFTDLCDDFITEAKNGEPYNANHLPKEPVDNFWILADLVIGLGLGYVIAFRKKGKLISVRRKVTAEDYTVPGSFVLNVNTDRFVRRFVTSKSIVSSEKKNSGSGSNKGGSTTHTSSSGRTHGGTSGKF
ncbi:MAG: TPM domain-containing protein [Candidatus Choladocola sp.]|nr:TPM domain-containing protein [Candidatus Choladocola sp.]